MSVNFVRSLDFKDCCGRQFLIGDGEVAFDVASIFSHWEDGVRDVPCSGEPGRRRFPGAW